MLDPSPTTFLSLRVTARLVLDGDGELLLDEGGTGHLPLPVVGGGGGGIRVGGGWVHAAVDGGGDGGGEMDGVVKVGDVIPQLGESSKEMGRPGLGR